jgi:predicted O-linked N-acetylglucosamine transferase (SPINDLY family)
MPELVTSSPSEYEELARSLARQPERLSALKAKLESNRINAFLFDTARYTHNLESAFTTMWERQQRGGAPESFAATDCAAPPPPAAQAPPP